MESKRATKVITAEVVAVIPEFRQTVTRSNGGWQYTVTRHAVGISWDKLAEGDIVELVVYTALPMVKEVLNVNKS